ncbi:hypothetical protein B0H15DRAFT_770522 [Mycena belliarum]|uniref:non-specific serine/threonine protein kinase n=1 Tax=Mycena belliarum TaxID=1033014 RepID=A0AAD6UG32_9AGAR|nr:hypothetical protein B0H15DRAFT_770522 [Mycena belliae]
MQWFRKGRRSINVSGGLSPNTAHQAAASSVEVASIPHTPVPPTQPSPSPFLVTPGTQEHRQRTTSAVSITSLFRRSAGVAGPSSGSRAAIRVHHGAVDHEMITAGRPTEVMQHMKDVLAGMGVDVQFEGDFKYRCIRPARHRDRRAEGVDTNGVCLLYGDLLVDIGDEVRFSVELTRLDRLKDMYSLDVRRLKGNLKSYKFLYDSLRT